MKPDWDKLMDEFADSKTQLVADVSNVLQGFRVNSRASIYIRRGSVILFSVLIIVRWIVLPKVKLCVKPTVSEVILP